MERQSIFRIERLHWVKMSFFPKSIHKSIKVIPIKILTGFLVKFDKITVLKFI